MNRTTLLNKDVASILQMGIAYRNDPNLTYRRDNFRNDLKYMCHVMDELFRCGRLSANELEQMEKFIGDTLEAWDCLTAGSMAAAAALSRGEEMLSVDATLKDRDEVYVWLIWDLLKAYR